MNIAIIKRASGFVALAFAIVFSFGISNEALAQRAPDTYTIRSDDTIVGVAPGQELLLKIYNGAANTVVPNVRVYGRTGTLLLSGVHTPLAPSQFDAFKLNYSDIPQTPGDSPTGRIEVRLELDMTYTGTLADAERIRSTFDLVKKETGESILIGMLLPAVQKVRDR